MTNAGGELLSLQSFTLSGTNASAFTTDGKVTDIKGAANATFTVTFKPNSRGDKKATLTIKTNVGDQKIELSGKGMGKVDITPNAPVNIPDKNFKKALLAHGVTITKVKLQGKEIIIGKIDANGDGIISFKEAANHNGAIVVDEKKISDLTGIEAFTTLTYLDCSKNKLTKIDVSRNIDLIGLYCYFNSITSLDISKNIALTALFCTKNQLSSLDIRENTALTTLSCWRNQLTNLDVSKNVALTYLSCGNNQLTGLDISKNTALTDLSCGDNNLINIDISKNISLRGLSFEGNDLTSIDISKNTSLTSLGCSYNKLTSLDLSKHSALTNLYCSGNQLTSLNVANGNNTKMKRMFATSNHKLKCIQHDQGFDPTKNTDWKKDDGAQWDTSCK